MTDPSPSDSSFASTSGPQCSICEKNAAIYTCPRCATRTCSLPCSNSHKSQTRCSGLRDKARYVPMNQYGLGTMMDDFVYLEEMGRKVGDWGKEIVRGGFGLGQSLGKSRDGAMGMRGGSQGRGRGRGRGGVQRTKRDVLKMQLELRDVDVDMLPTGMAKRMVNQSTWDFKYVRRNYCHVLFCNQAPVIVETGPPYSLSSLNSILLKIPPPVHHILRIHHTPCSLIATTSTYHSSPSSSRKSRSASKANARVHSRLGSSLLSCPTKKCPIPLHRRSFSCLLPSTH